jgi:hypothetical protein
MNPIWILPFALFSFLFFTIPGFLIFEISKSTFGFWQKIFFGTVIGYVIFTLVSYLFLVLGLGILIIPCFIIIDLYFFKSFRKKFVLGPILKGKKLLIVTLVFTIGIIGQLLIISPSGWSANGNLLFWSSHAHDASWHFALVNEIQKMSFGSVVQNPEYAGTKLVNYHIFSDIAPAIFNKYLLIPQIELYFRLFPLLYSILLGTVAYFLGKVLGKSFSAGIWSTIFIYFGGSFGYIATLIQHKGIGGESIFWGSQIQSSIGNPPFIAANIILITFLYLFLKILEKNNRTLFFISAMLLGSLAVFKIYASIVLFFALGIAGVWEIIRERKFRIISLIIPSGILSAILFLPFYGKSSSFLILQPWWYIRAMIADPSRLNWIDLELRRQFYVARGGIRSILRIIEYEGIAFSIFFIGNIGMRFLGLFDLVSSAKTFFKNYFNQVFILMTLLSLIFPLLFLQKGVAGGTANFLEYFILGFGFFAALTTARLIEKIKYNALKLCVGLIIIILAVPTQAALIYQFYSRNPFTKITNAELTALNFVKSNTDKNAIILTPPYDPNLDLKDPIPNIWDWFDTAYVSAFSARRSYFDDYEQVDIMGYDYRSRLAVKQTIFKNPDVNLVKEKLKETKAQILYFPKILHPLVDLTKTGLIKVYENSEVEVWKIS